MQLTQTSLTDILNLVVVLAALLAVIGYSLNDTIVVSTASARTFARLGVIHR